jgi:hypothetical protein
MYLSNGLYNFILNIPKDFRIITIIRKTPNNGFLKRFYNKKYKYFY